MKRINLVLGIHNHLPVGSFDSVFEEAYQKAHLPFLATLESHPHVKLAVHFSGILLEWISEHHPDYVPRLRTLVKDERVEMITGGYYEPILAMIPERDRLGQIRKLTEFLREKTGDSPVGMWCTGGVWEPHLVKSMRDGGVRYTLLDDTYFTHAGLGEEDLCGYFVTEEMGTTLNVFPVRERLKTLIPCQKPEGMVEVLRKLANEEGDRVVVFAGDGEEFGLGSGTYTHDSGEGWLEDFFTLLRENGEWIRLAHFREVLEKFPPRGRVYFPTVSWSEMMKGVLPIGGNRECADFEEILKKQGLWDRYKTTIGRGSWRDFLARYPEANTMHKKMLWVSRKVQEVEEKIPKTTFEKAQNYLWAGQCNDSYWPGGFGGIYLPHLRCANFYHLITAGRIVDEATRPRRSWVDCRVVDFDGDGREEILLESRRLNLYFSTLGGSLFELDDRRLGINFLNLLTRGDRHRRGSFIDHFLEEGTTLEKFSQCRYREQGDFVDQPYDYRWEQKGNRVVLTMERRGTVRGRNEQISIHLKKVVQLIPDQPEFFVVYTLENKETTPVEVWFGVEQGFAFPAGDDPKRYYDFEGRSMKDRLLNSLKSVDDVEKIALVDEQLGFAVRVSFSCSAGVWCFPLETVSMSKGGFGRVYQGSVILSHWKLRLEKRMPWRVEIINQVDMRR